MIKILLYGDIQLTNMIYFDSLRNHAYEVAALVVDEEYFNKNLRPFREYKIEDAIRLFNPDEYFFIIADLRVRTNESKMLENIRKSGFKLTNYFSDLALITSNMNIGTNNIIMEFAYIGSNVSIGSNNIIRQYSYIGHDSRLENDINIGIRTTLAGFTVVDSFSWIGTDVTIVNKARVARSSILGAGTVVIRSTEANTTYVGNPQRRIK